MTTNQLKIIILCILMSLAGLSEAQKNIAISDSLNSNSEKLNVKMGGQGFGKIWKFRFGEYGVVSSKSGWMITTSKSNFFNSKTDSKSSQKFSFILSNKSDSVSVNAAQNISVQSLNEIEILPHFSWGNNELQKESNNFTAFITLTKDTLETWALLMNVARGKTTEESYEAFLTNGEKKIFITPASSDKKGNDNRSMPALGYEFVENGKSLGAVQYYGGGLLGLNKNIVWISKELNPKMKLIMAGAITSILQIKVTAPGF